ncbi:flavoprotein [Acinetobacter schindleri]|uniref:flavoprotein n=1 Tax=Acinetobacter schindleri TaxID=108981 RepID=UPI00209BB596|nr:flavoprotein [Acinetobacter schindleri]MCO8067961.1 flavoprotein [Acinetobacter schindleri]
MGVKQDTGAGIFQNNPEHFKSFNGTKVDSAALKDMDFQDLNVAVIGLDQFSVSHLDRICQQAASVKVFQIEPQFVMPSTSRTLQRVLNHPLISKNKNLISNRIKGLLSLRFLEQQVKNPWLRRQLMPNLATSNRHYFKSDSFYIALQRENCQLITWPILKISDHAIHCIHGENYPVDVIIQTFK